MSQNPELSLTLDEDLRRKENVDEFIKQFVAEQNINTKAGDLHLFAQSYLQSLKGIDNEDRRNFFITIIAKIPELFAVLTDFNNVECMIKGKDLKALNLQSATLCLETMLLCLQCSKTTAQLQSLIQTALNILYQAYSHCKDSESLYGNLLEEFTDQLAIFFKRIQDVQAAMIMDLNRLMSANLCEIDTTAIVTISVDMGKLSELVNGLDTVIASKLWRAFIKIISRHREIVREKLEMDSVLSTLISSISDLLIEFKFKLENEKQVAESDIKMFLFQLNLVMKIFHTCFGNLNRSIRIIITLTLELYKLLVACYSPLLIEGNSVNLIKNALINGITPMIPLFFSDNVFLISAFELQLEEISRDFHIPYLLLKLTALNNFSCNDDNMNAIQKGEILKTFFSTLQTNSPEDDLIIISWKISQCLFSGVGNMSSGIERLDTIYQQVYTQLSQYSRKISDDEFATLDSYMTSIMRSSSEVTSLLASDVWMYRLRCSSVDYLYSHCIRLSQTVLELDPKFYHKQHLKRMIKFLPPNEKLKLFEEYGNLKSLLYGSQTISHRFGIQEISLSQIEDPDPQKNISILLNELKTKLTNDGPNLLAKACCILELFSLLVPVSENADIMMFTEFASRMFKSEVYEIQIAVLTFLKALKSKQLSDKQPEFRNIITCLATLLKETLRSKNYLTRLEAFNTYSNLAHSTPHPQILQETATMAPDLIPAIKSYFSKIPSTGFLSEKDRMENSKIQLCSDLHNRKRPFIVSDESKALLYQLLCT